MIKLSFSSNIVQTQEIELPTSKSISNRVLLIYALAQEVISLDNLHHLAICDDTFVMKQALMQNKDVKEIDVQAAGTAMRFLTAYYALKGTEVVLNGTKRMQERPIHLLVDALNTLGANISYTKNEGFPPLLIKKRALQGGRIAIKSNVSSQYISALLLIAPYLKDGLRIELAGPIFSKTYIDMTISLMKEFGASVEWINENTILVNYQPYTLKPYTVESDWSAASYWYAFVALHPEKEINLFLPYLYQASEQGDKQVAVWFEHLGVGTEYLEKGIKLFKNKQTKAFFCEDFALQPDLAQTFSVTCAYLNIPFHLKGLQSLRIKETDRILALQTELNKLGFRVTTPCEGELKWEDVRQPIQSKVIDTYQDHRMALAFAPIVLKEKELWINNPEVVTKSYPDYWTHLMNVGINIEQK